MKGIFSSRARERLAIVVGAALLTSGGFAMLAVDGASGDSTPAQTPVPAVAVNPTGAASPDVPLSDLAQVPNEEPPMPPSRPEPAAAVNVDPTTDDAPASQTELVQPVAPLGVQP